MKKTIVLFAIMTFLSGILMAQSKAYSIKGGLTVGTQKWENTERDPLLSYHIVGTMESAPEDNSFALFMEVGYHVKGSAWRNTRFTNQGGGITFSSQKFKYKNLALVLGVKKNYKETDNMSLYYLFGLRGDYTVGTNLGDYERFNEINGAPVFPFKEAVRKFNYGATLGTGVRFPFTEFISGVMEFTIAPDFSQQYRQGPFSANILINGASTNRTFAKREIVNLVFEVSLGLRFLHKIEYID